MRTYNPPPKAPIDILYQDDFLLAVNKPDGLLSVPGRGEDKQDCMAERVQQDFPGALIVHRLDMATSGILLMALDPATHREMSRLFEQRQVEKAYIAVVSGHIDKHEGEINAPMICDWPNRPRQMIDHENGKPAITRYSLLEKNNDMTSRVELKPYTGRTHQLRVHMMSIGHAIVGDELYNAECEEQPRLLLHANLLCFSHPVTAEKVAIRSEPPF